MTDLFYECEGYNVSYADDETPHSCATDISSITLDLQVLETKLSSWFKNSYLKINPEIVSIDETPNAAISSKISLGVTVN